MRRKILLVALAILFLSLLLPQQAYAAPSRDSEIEITPKVTIKGPAAAGKAAKPPKQAATGILGQSLTGNAWAVVIGISDYSGTANDIQYADDDALDMLSALINVYGYKRENILLLISDYTTNNATREYIVGAIGWLKDKETSGDEVVFFYSGHGARGKANDGDKELIDEAIVPYECTAKSLIWDGELAAMFSGFETSRIIFIFDSCYAGGMTDLKANGRIVAMACSESGLSYEGEAWGGGHGQFTYYFVDKGMLSGYADIYDHDKDGTLPEGSDVTVEEAFDYAKANCVYQTPVISDSFANDLLL